MRRRRDQLRKTVSPLYDRNSVTKKIIIQRKTRGRACIFKSKEIEMIDGEPASWILVHNRESRTCHGTRAAQASHQPLAEMRLSCPKVALQRHDVSRAESVRETLTQRFGFRRAIGSERSHREVFD